MAASLSTRGVLMMRATSHHRALVVNGPCHLFNGFEWAGSRIHSRVTRSLRQLQWSTGSDRRAGE